MDPAFHIAVSQCVDRDGEEKEQKKTTTLRRVSKLILAR